MVTRLLILLAVAVVALAVVLSLSGRDESPSPEPARPAGSAPAAQDPDDLPGLPEGSEEEDAAAAEGRGDLLATVLDAEGRPVAWAVVTTAVDGAPEASRSATSDAEGLARFEGLPAGRTVSVRAEADLTSVPATVTAPVEADETTEVRLVLKTGGAVTGRVVTEGGDAPDVRFTVSVGPAHEWARPESSIVATRSFPAGTAEFQVGGVPPGRHVARASAEGFGDGVSEPFDVRKGETTAGIVITLPRGSRVSGVVRRLDTGEPVPRARVSIGTARVFLSPGGLRTGKRSAETDARGRFTLAGLAPGVYALWSTAAGLAPGVIEELMVEQGRDVTGLVLSMGVGGTITGTVYGPDGKPVPAGIILYRKWIPEIVLKGDFGERVKADEEGVYRIEHLVPGKYVVRRVVARNLAISVAVRSGPEEDERRHADVVEVREGEVVRRDILVGSGKGGLEGRLTDAGGEPLATRWVSLTGLMEREASPGEFRLPHTTMTDGEGEFAFRDLEPGDYTVEALGTRQKVTVVAAETREITIAVDTARIEGVVVDETGRPVPGAEVALERQGAGPGRRFMLESGEVTDTMGRFVFAKVGPGSYRVSVEEGDSQALSDVFQVDPGGVRKGIRLALEALVT
ncbi:MAG: MSCRAMM family protein, partial [Planctomycetota bacterium]